MQLSRHDLLLITAILQHPLYVWRELIAGCGMAVGSACASRDRLLRARVIRTAFAERKDVLGRAKRTTVYCVTAEAPIIDEIRAWIDARQAYPWPGPPHPRPRAVSETATKPPGVHADPYDRLLETILRNPGATWTAIRDASGIQSVEAREARDELLNNGSVSGTTVAFKRRDGRGGMRFAFVPNEEHVLVREMRKRYGLVGPVASEVPAEILRARELIRSTPAREGSAWRIEDVDTDRALHAKARVRRES